MAIGSAIERGSQICVFDEHGRMLFSKARGSGPKDGLAGIHWRHRHNALWFDHLHVRRERHDAVLKGGMIDCIIPGGLSRRRCA